MIDLSPYIIEFYILLSTFKLFAPTHVPILSSIPAFPYLHNKKLPSPSRNDSSHLYKCSPNQSTISCNLASLKEGFPVLDKL